MKISTRAKYFYSYHFSSIIYTHAPKRDILEIKESLKIKLLQYTKVIDEEYVKAIKYVLSLMEIYRTFFCNCQLIYINIFNYIPHSENFWNNNKKFILQTIQQKFILKFFTLQNFFISTQTKMFLLITIRCCRSIWTSKTKNEKWKKKWEML
jgi:hypothetical protein